MKVIYGINKIRRFKRPVVALGVFDGVHRGHRDILKAAVKEAQHIGGTSIVLTFWPHPQKEESLYSLQHRLRLIEGLGIDVCIVVKFNQKFAQILAEDFVKKILVKKLKAHYVFIGKNFRFGKKAAGDFRTLKKFSRIYNFRLRLFNVLKINNRAISSTHIRTLIKQGDIKSARKLLTRPVSILGTVIKGSSLARRLGFPTANIDPHHEVIPPSGVYAVKIIFHQRQLKGVCYIGTKPTFNTQYAIHNTQYEKHIEIHIFNFKQNLYSKYLEIQFEKRIREEKQFSSIGALAKQIKKDIFKAKRLFSYH